MEDLSGRTAIVTGTGSGIGLAIAWALVTEGTQVVMADIEFDKARDYIYTDHQFIDGVEQRLQSILAARSQVVT